MPPESAVALASVLWELRMSETVIRTVPSEMAPPLSEARMTTNAIAPISPAAYSSQPADWTANTWPASRAARRSSWPDSDACSSRSRGARPKERSSPAAEAEDDRSKIMVARRRSVAIASSARLVTRFA